MFKRNQLVGAASAVVLGVALMAFASYQIFDSKNIELTKEEALSLMNAQTAAVMAVADRDEIVQLLCVKYGVSLESHSLNVATGQFVPRSQNVRSKNDGNGGRPPDDASAKPDDSDATAGDAVAATATP